MGAPLCLGTPRKKNDPRLELRWRPSVDGMLPFTAAPARKSELEILAIWDLMGFIHESMDNLWIIYG